MFRKISQSSLTQKQRTISQIQNDILSDFEDSPSFVEIEINGASKEVHIVTDKKDNKIMLSKPDESFSVGDIVTWNNNKFLVTDIDENQDIQTKGIIQLCTNTFNFYHNNTLYQIPCIVESNVRLYQLGTDETKYISEPSTNIIVRLSNTEITSQIQRDQIYKLGVSSYKVVDISDILEPGLIIFKLEYSQEEQKGHIFVLTILNGNSLQIAQSQSLTINAQLSDNGEIVNSPALLYSSSNESVATIADNGVVTILTTGSTVFTVQKSDDSTIKDIISVEIVADEQQDNYTYTIEGNSEVIKGYTQDYIAKKYNNGILVEGAEFTFTFSVIPGTTPTNAYTLNTIDGDECSITANLYTYYITLRATDNSNGEYVEKSIKLRNLF